MRRTAVAEGATGQLIDALDTAACNHSLESAETHAINDLFYLSGRDGEHNRDVYRPLSASSSASAAAASAPLGNGAEGLSVRVSREEQDTRRRESLSGGSSLGDQAAE